MISCPFCNSEKSRVTATNDHAIAIPDAFWTPWGSSSTFKHSLGSHPKPL
jgi:hypothetical protein